MTEHDDPIQAAARLEQALERIATLAAARPAQAARVPPDPARAANAAVEGPVAALTDRLDSLISELRAALDG